MRSRSITVLGVAAALAGCDGDDDSARSGERPGTGSSPASREGVFGEVPQIVDEVRPAVVAVFATSDRGRGEGSGVVWNEDGIVVTNNHVVEGASKLEIQLATGERVAAKRRAADPLTDLAVLEAERRRLPAAEFAEGLPDVGELAVAIGNPLGFESSVTAGIVSGVDRSIPTGGNTPALVGLIQTDAAISPGNSGGALVNADGDVIGINVAFIPPQQRAVSIGFAIPAPTVVDVVDELLDDGEVDHAFLGVALDPLTAEIAERFDIDAEAGAIVAAVGNGTPADEAGIRRGDVIVRMAGREIRSIEDVFVVLREREPGERITLEVVRSGQRVEVEAELSERPG